MTSTPHREGQPNPDAAIVEAALEKVPVSDAVQRSVWLSVHFDGWSANKLAAFWQRYRPTFAAALREGIAARRGQRFGGHGGWVMPAEISVDAAVNFLNEAERYFRRLPTLSEDATHWANQSNADNCAKIANLLIRQARKAHDDGQALLTALRDIESRIQPPQGDEK